MMTEIKAPSSANAEGRLSIGRWFKSTGDPVSLNEPVVEINTDQGMQEIQAPATGVLATILLRDGTSVEAGAVLGTIRQF